MTDVARFVFGDVDLTEYVSSASIDFEPLPVELDNSRYFYGGLSSGSLSMSFEDATNGWLFREMRRLWRTSPRRSRISRMHLNYRRKRR